MLIAVCQAALLFNFKQRYNMIPDNILRDLAQGKRLLRLEWWGRRFRTFAWNITVPSINHPQVMSIINGKCFKHWRECRVYDITNSPELYNQECKSLARTRMVVKNSNVSLDEMMVEFMQPKGSMNY